MKNASRKKNDFLILNQSKVSINRVGGEIPESRNMLFFKRS